MKEKCHCTFCEEELVEECMEPPFCQPCEIVFIHCKNCGKAFSNRLSVCPKCGTKIPVSQNG